MSTELLAAAKALPVSEKLELISQLWASIEEEDHPQPTEAEMQLIEERLREHEANPDDVVPLQEVMATLAKRNKN